MPISGIYTFLYPLVVPVQIRPIPVFQVTFIISCLDKSFFLSHQQNNIFYDFTFCKKPGFQLSIFANILNLKLGIM